MQKPRNWWVILLHFHKVLLDNKWGSYYCQTSSERSRCLSLKLVWRKMFFRVNVSFSFVWSVLLLLRPIHSTATDLLSVTHNDSLGWDAFLFFKSRREKVKEGSTLSGKRQIKKDRTVQMRWQFFLDSEERNVCHSLGDFTLYSESGLSRIYNVLLLILMPQKDIIDFPTSFKGILNEREWYPMEEEDDFSLRRVRTAFTFLCTFALKEEKKSRKQEEKNK